MAFLFVGVALLYTALVTKHFPRIQAFGLDIVGRLDTFLTNALGEKRIARKFLPLVGGFFVFIFLGNVFGLIYDWVNLSFPVMHAYLRPINSDMNTTVVLALTTIVVAQLTGIFKKGFFHHFLHYLFNFSGSSLVEKIINVPVGWIHFLGEFTRIISLSVRLFANIFAGHTIILSLICMIFIFGAMNRGVGFGFSIVSVGFSVYVFSGAFSSCHSGIHLYQFGSRIHRTGR